MKNKLVWIGLFLGMLILLVELSVVAASQSLEEIYREGDILYSPAGIGHDGMIVRDNNNNLVIRESHPDVAEDKYGADGGTGYTSIEDFYKRYDNKVKHLRVDVDVFTAKKAAEYAKKIEGPFGFFWPQVYCSGLVYNAYKKGANIDLCPILERHVIINTPIGPIPNILFWVTPKDIYESAFTFDYRPGGDHPDDTFDLSNVYSMSLRENDLYNSYMRLALKKNKTGMLLLGWLMDNWYNDTICNEIIQENLSLINMDYQTTPDVAVLRNGFSNLCNFMLAGFSEPTSNYFSDFKPTILQDHPVLIIPSGGLYGLDSLPTFKKNLEQYVENGGNLIVFSQQHGYEYNALPGGNLSGFGWFEDQSCHFQSVRIANYHPILSGQNSTLLSINVDGYFTKWPENSKILLTRTKNEMPAMIMYEYGKGTIIATTAYTDWASGHEQMIQSGKNLVRDMISWARFPEDIPDYVPEENINFSIEVTNKVDITADKVVFTFIDPDKNIADYVNISLIIYPNETKFVNFTNLISSKLGIWCIDYSLINNTNVTQTVHEVQKFSVSKYTENPDGFVYQGKSINFAVTAPDEFYSHGSNIPFTVHIWNEKDYDRDIRCYGSGGLNSTVTVPANGEYSFAYIVENAQGIWLRFSVGFYENDENLGSANKVIWLSPPLINLTIQTNQREYTKGDNVTVSLNLTNKQNITYNSNITVRILDFYNMVIFKNTFNVNLTAYKLKNVTMTVTIPETLEYGTYIVSAEVYSNNKKIESGSTYFKIIKEYEIKLNFDKPDKAYKIRKFMELDIEIINNGYNFLNSTINISIPDLAFNASKYISLAHNETVQYLFNFSIPENITVGIHKVYIISSYDNYVITNYFIITESKIRIASSKANYSAGEYFEVNLTNIGGIDTIFNCTVEMFESYRARDLNKIRIFRNYVIDNISTGENKIIEFKIPELIVDGEYYFLIWCKNLRTNITRCISRTCKITGLKASITSYVDKKTYYIDENVSIHTNITNLNGKIINGLLKLKVFTPSLFLSPLNVPSIYDLSIPNVNYSINWENYSFLNNLTLSFDETTWGLNDILYVGGTGLNNYTSIQDAIDNSSNGTTIFVYDGIYYENVVIDKTITLIGENRNTTVIDGGENGAVINVTADMVNVTNFSIRNNVNKYDILRTPFYDIKSHIGIMIHSSSNNIISNCEIHNNSNGIHISLNSNNNTIVFNNVSDNYAGIYLLSNNNTIYRNNISSDIYGMKLISSENNTIMGNSINNNHYHGIHVWESDNNKFINNIIKSNQWNGILFVRGSKNTIISGNNFDLNSGNSLYLIDCNYMLITRNNIFNTKGGSGVYLYSYPGSGNNNTIIGNTISYNDQKGIYFLGDGANNNNIYGNNISFNGDEGILISSSKINNNTFLNNNISSNGRSGLAIYASKKNTIIGNNILANGRNGIGISSGENNTIIGNAIISNELKGLYLPYQISSTIFRNNISSNSESGIYFHSSTNNKIMDNIILYNTLNGIRLRYSSNYNIISNNTLIQNGDNGIYFMSSLYNNISHNIINNNLKNGIYLYMFSWDNNISSNIIMNNGYSGIQSYYYAAKNIITNCIVSNNSLWGIKLTGAYDTIIYNNYFNNSYNAFDDGTNYWNLMKTEKENIIGGSFIGGNYWSDYIGDDYDGDLIGDTDIPYNSNGNIQNGGDYYPLIIPKWKILWEKEIQINLGIFENHTIIIELPSEVLNIGKLRLSSMFCLNSSQIIAQAELCDFFITCKNTSITLETNKKVYKPNETITIYGQIQNNANISKNYTFLLNKNDVEILSENFTLAPDNIYNYSTYTTSTQSFSLDGTVDNITVKDYIEVVLPIIDVSIISTDTVEMDNFLTTVLIENYANVDANLNVTMTNITKEIILKGRKAEILPFNITPPAIDISGIDLTTLNELNIYDTDEGNIIDIKKIIGHVNETAILFQIETYRPMQTESMGYLWIDVDQDPNTGLTSNVLSGYGLNDIGAEYLISIYIYSSRAILYHWTGNSYQKISDLTLNITNYTVSFSVLLSDIDDPGDIDVTAIFGDTWTWIDIVPDENHGSIICKPIHYKMILDIHISGDVQDDKQKEVILGEINKITLDPASTYLDGSVKIPFILTNIGLLDSDFNATFSVDDQIVTKRFFVPQNQNITGTINFNLSQGVHTLNYTSPFEQISTKINVLSPPDFIVSSIFPQDKNFIAGQNISLTFLIKNIGGTEGEVAINLMMPDFEDKNRTWIMPGDQEKINFSLTIPDDLMEGDYIGYYELNGEIDRFFFSVQGANISVVASLDKKLYEENETAVLTLNVTNECVFNLSLYARVKLNDYEEIKYFNITDHENLTFFVPAQFNGHKLFYGIYMVSGRALYLNALFVYKKNNISLYTDKQVYNIGESVSIFIETGRNGTLNLTAPDYSIEKEINDSLVLNFIVPELLSGTYNIDYIFDNESYTYPFDVYGYSARILECNLNKYVYNSSDVITAHINLEVNQDISGEIKMWIYDPQYSIIDTFIIGEKFVKGENEIVLSRSFIANSSGIHAFVFNAYAHSDLILIASGAEYFDVFLTSQPPVANIGGPYLAEEGKSIILNASLSYDPDDDELKYRWDFENDGIWDTTYSISPIANYTWNDDYSGTVMLEVYDGAFTDIATTTVTINNVAPNITSLALTTDPIAVNTTIHLTANFTDPGGSDIHNATIRWGDGNTSFIDISEGNYTVNCSFNYSEAGVYTVNITIRDDDGGNDSRLFQYIVIYDPSGGFVTGGGWINSSEGAYAPDPTLTGKANFGFVSKYKRGQQSPTGNTEFQFHAADMNFHSNNYDWLVVTHHKAIYKGTGTINGTGNYGFMLSAIDEELTNSTDIDMFRIKIWDKDDNDTVVYDNQLGDDEDADPTTEICGGQIVIHKV